MQETINAIDAIPAKRFSIDESMLLEGHSKVENEEEEDRLYERKGLKDIMFYQEDT